MKSINKTQFTRIVLPITLVLITVLFMQIKKVNNRNSENANPTTFMTFNIRYDNPNDHKNAWFERKEDVVRLISYYSPDIFGIQEGQNHQVKYILNNTKNYKYIGVARDDGKVEGEFCAIYFNYKKFTLKKQETFWLSKTPDTISMGWDAAYKRICTYGVFVNKKTQEEFHVFNTHFDHIGEVAKSKSAKLILDKIREYKLTKSKIVVMGDLNSTPTTKPIVTLTNELDIRLDILTGPIGTFNKFDPSMETTYCIDYILTKNLNVATYKHINDKRSNGLCVSDHLPVYISVD